MAMTSDQAWEEILAERARRRVNEWRRDRNHSLSKGIKERDRCFGLRFIYLWTEAYKKAQASKRFSTIPGYGAFS